MPSRNCWASTGREWCVSADLACCYLELAYSSERAHVILVTEIKVLPLTGRTRDIVVRVSQVEFAEACLRIDWPDAIRARENWNVNTFIDDVLLWGISLPISWENVLLLVPGRMAYHVGCNLIVPQGVSVH